MVRNRKKDVEMERPKDQTSRSGVFSSPSAVSDAMPTTRDGVASWSCERVSQWLNDNGFQRYSHLIAEEHGVDGYALLMLSESDLRQPPLQLTVLGDIKKLGHALNELRRTRHDRVSSSPPPVDKHQPSLSLDSSNELSSDIRRQDNHCCQGHHHVTHSSPKPSPHIATHPTSPSDCEECRWQRHFHALRQHSAPDETPTLLLANGLSTSNSYRVNREYIIRQVESPDSQAKMLFKTFIAFLYCLASLLITALVMVIVHDRVPDMKMYPPLPDIVLDNVPLIPWAFEVCELCALLMAFVWLMVLILHKHRTVIMRRMFSLVGTVFLLRCVTMLITSLSVPGIHLECSSKKYTSVWEKMAEAYRIWSHMGMSVQGVRSCGDYMFSGHTTAITLLNHFITEYTPETWHFLHTATWVLNLFGIFFILAGHEHYSIDVFIAFYITSRLFLYYHALAYNNSVSPMSHYDKRTRMWFPLSWFFESGGHGRVINEYELPVPDLHTIRDVVASGVSWARTWWQARWQTEQLQPDTAGRQTPKRDKNKRTPR